MDSTKQLGEGPIVPLLAKFALPSIIGMVVGALYNVVDRIFIGQGVGDLALAGVTVAFAVQLIQIAASVLVGVGAAALISISLGQKNRDKAELVLGNGLCLNFLISAFVAILGIVFLDPLLRIFGASAEVLPYARSFTFVILLGTPLSTICWGLNGFIRSEGKPRVAMVTQLIGPALNVILCPIFIFALKWGIVGSAIATVLSQAVGSIWVLAYYFSGRSLLKIRLANLRPRREIALSIFALGSSVALSDLAASIVNGVMNNQLLAYGGDKAVSAMGVVFAIGNLTFLTLIGMAMGTQPLIGYNIGAKLYHRVRKIALAAIGAATVFTTVIFAGVQLFPAAFVSLFAGPDSNLGEIGVYALRHNFLLLPLMGLQVLGSSFFQASGKPMKALFLGLSRQVIIFVPTLIILPLFWGLDGVWNAQPIADGIAFVLTAILFGREMRMLGKKA